jgi:hypothetical protein
MKLTFEGILFLILAWGSISVLLGYCFLKVLKNEKK